MTKHKLTQVLAILAAVVLFSSCATVSESGDRNMLPVKQAIVQDAAPDVSVTFEKIDESLKGDSNKHIALMYFDKPVLSGPSPSVDAINTLFEQETEAFFRGTNDNAHFNQGLYDYFFDHVQNMRSHHGDDDLAKQPLVCTVDTEVVYNSEQIISVKETFTWFAGGISSTNYYGITASVETGELLPLSSISTESIDVFNNRVIQELKRSLKSEGIKFQAALETAIHDYSYHDYEYCFDGEHIFLMFNDGVFANSGYILELTHRKN